MTKNRIVCFHIRTLIISINHFNQKVFEIVREGVYQKDEIEQYE